MNKETARSLEKIRELMIQSDRYKRYVRICEIEWEYRLNKEKAVNLAKACGAYTVINKLAMVDVDAFDEYYRKLTNDKEEE